MNLSPRPAQENLDQAPLGRYLLDKQFHGDLEGTSKGDMLSASTESTGAAAYVALEVVKGTLGGRTGSFVLTHVGTMTRDSQHLTVTVVPGSGTEQLVGINGTLIINIVDKKHLYEFNYTLPDAR